MEWGGQVHAEHEKHVPVDMLFVLEGGVEVTTMNTTSMGHGVHVSD